MNTAVEQTAPNDVSVASTETAPVEVAQGVTSEDSPASQVQSPENSPPEQKAGKDEILDIVQDAIKPAESETKAEEAAPKKDEPEAEVKAEVEEPKALSQEQQVKVPNEQRPEWQKLVSIGDKLGKQAGKEVRETLRDIYRKEAKYVEQIEKSKPAIEMYREMYESVSGSEQGLANIRRLVQVNETNPAEAVPMFEMLLNDAKKRAGMVLQSPELLTEAQALDKQVQDGYIDQAAADKRKSELLELQKARLGTERTQAELKAERDRQERAQSAQQEQQSVNEINQAETKWAADKQKSDPDFVAVQTLHTAFLQQNSLEFWDKNKKLPNAVESVAILEKSFKMAKAEAMKFKPKPEAKKPVMSNNNGSSAQHRQQPRNSREEIEAIINESLARA